jgi:bacteriocin-like protein
MLINLRDWKKRRVSTHTLESATILPDELELSDEQLSHVIGGMSPAQFEVWKVRKLNENR